MSPTQSPIAQQVQLPFNYNDFRGGLNTRDAATLLTDNQARDLQNVQGTIAGAITKRNGLATFATPPVALTSLVPFEAIASPVMIAAGGTSLYSITPAAVVTAIKTGLTNGQRWEFVSAPAVGAQGPLYGVNGIDPPQAFNGGAATTAWTNTSGGVAIPNGKYCVYSNNQVFITGVTATPSRVYWSAIADPTNFDPASLTGAGFADFDPTDGQPITAIGTVGPYVLVAKSRKLWVIVDTATATIRRLSTNVGCIAHRSLASGSEGTYFLAEDRGVYLTNGSKLQPISDLLQPTFNSLPQAQRAFAAAGYFNSHYYLSISLGGSTNDTVLDYDAQLESWWKHTFGSQQFAIWHAAPGTPALYSAKATSAIVDNCFVPGVRVDNGTPFTWVWRGPWQSPSFYRRRLFPTPYYRKRLRQVRYRGVGTVNFSLAKDFITSEVLIQTNIFPPVSAFQFGGPGVWADPGQNFGGAAQFTKGQAYTLGVANAFSLVFSGASTTDDLITDYTLYIADRRDSQF